MIQTAFCPHHNGVNLDDEIADMDKGQALFKSIWTLSTLLVVWTQMFWPILTMVSDFLT